MKKIFSKLNMFLTAILVTVIAFSVITVVNAVTPNPGHSWTEVGDGVFSVTGPTSARTYTFPDNNATIVTSSSSTVNLNDENLWVCLGGSCAASTPAENGNVIVETSVILNNNFRLKQTGASTVDMLDSGANVILEFDESS